MLFDFHIHYSQTLLKNTLLSARFNKRMGRTIMNLHIKLIIYFLIPANSLTLPNAAKLRFPPFICNLIVLTCTMYKKCNHDNQLTNITRP